MADETKDKAPENKDTDPKGQQGTEQKKEAEPKTYTIKVDGQELSLTEEEMIARATESSGAQKKFADASAMSKKAAKGIQILELLDQTKGDNPDPDKVKELLTLLGVDESGIQEVLANMNPDNNDTKDKKTSSQTGTTTPNRKISLDDVDERLKGALEAAEKADLKQIRENIEGEAKKTIDNDKILGKILDDITDDAARQNVKSVLYEMMIDDVRGRILGREAYGPEMLTTSLQKVRGRVQKFGTPSKSAAVAPVMGELGISEAFGPEIRATEPIKRKKTSEEGYEENAVKRVQQLFFRAMSRGRK